MWIPNIRQVRNLRQRFSQSFSMTADVFSIETISSCLSAHGIFYRRCLFDPVVTILTWVMQLLSPDRSCNQALSLLYAFIGRMAAVPDSPDTGAYCKARKRLIEPVLIALYSQLADRLEAKIEPSALFFGRRVFLVDGTSVLAPDTPENQAAYPQHSHQKQGCGFPLIKLVGFLSLNTGAVHKAMPAPFQRAEISLFREQLEQIAPNDIIVADRHYSSYADLCLVKARRADALFRLHQARKVDWKKGERLGPYDRLVLWKKPLQCPQGLAPEIYARLPEKLMVRLLRYTIAQEGFRTRVVTVVTTLCDPERYPSEKLATLYALRGQVEIDLRHIKSTMHMDMLSCKSPQMLRKELAVYFLTYNLICACRQQAAYLYKRPVLRISFKGAREQLNTFMPILAYAGKPLRRALIALALYMSAVRQWIDRPGRFEPRLRKRRPKHTNYLQEPRKVIKQKLILQYTLVQ